MPSPLICGWTVAQELLNLNRKARVEFRIGWGRCGMGSFKVRHLVQKKSGYYFEATPRMREFGFSSEPLGKNFHKAAERCAHLNAGWDRVRKGEDIRPVSAAARGTFQRLVDELMVSAEFLDKSRARQDEIEYSLKLILPVFGPARLASITPENCEGFYGVLRQLGSVHKAARVLKDLRYLLNRAVRLGHLSTNPALAFKVKKPKPRAQTWTEDQVMSAINAAWAEGFQGLAVALSIMYDTSLRPGDVRSLTWEQIKGDRISLVTAKTDTSTAKPVWPETIELLNRYRAELGVEPLPTALVIRTRRGRPYAKDRLARDARMVLRNAGIPDAVQMRDLRRTASKERAEAGATEAELAAATDHSIERGSQILDTYNPRSFALAKAAQDKRRRNKKAQKVGKSLA